MSLAGESKEQDMNSSQKSATRCRIPQRLPVAKTRPMSCKSKTSSDATARPKSANRIRDDSYSRISHMAQRTVRPDKERHLKRPAMPLKKMMNDSKTGKSVITIPLATPSQKQKYYAYSADLPDQETIKKCEDLELEVTLSPGGEDSSRSGEDLVTNEINWQQCLTRFEAMKNDLGERQKAVMELYANMTNAHQQMTAMGKKVTMPSSEDLTILNVAKLTPDQLLQLCAAPGVDVKQNGSASLVIDVQKLYSLPSKIIATCEETLSKRKEIIDWFVVLMSQTKGISYQSLEIKINEFKSENEMLKSSLEHAKGDFCKELNVIIQFMRDTVNEAIALQLRTEEQTCELSKMNSLNTDLQKQLHNSEILRSNKSKLEELEKELKEEKCKRKVLRDRLSRAEGQVKMGTERASQLEEALDQSRTKSCNMERTLQQLQEQKQNMQAEFDNELRNLKQSIQDNTIHLEEIAEARQKIQTEKEDLEKRLGELSQHYNDSLKSMKHDMNINIAKLIDTEKKYEEEVEQRQNLQVSLESLSKQSRDYENRSRELFTQLQEMREQLSKALDYEKELHTTKRDLHLALSDIEDYKMRITKQSETIKILKSDLEDSFTSISNLKSSLKDKEEYISELENKQLLLQEQLQESESKMITYEQQLASLKDHIDQLQEDFGQFESLTELHDMINQQRAKLLEATTHNEELAQELQKKEMELEQNLDKMAVQEQVLKQKEGVIKMLTEKEMEQNNILKLLRTNLEMRTKGDMDLSHQIIEKNSEIQTLLSNLNTRKKQISQLEKIILTLEEKNRKYSQQRKIDEDKISALEKQISEINAYHLELKGTNNMPDNNIDNIIKIFEEELGTSFESQLTSKSNEYVTSNNKLSRDKRQDFQNFENCKGNIKQTRYPTEHESVPTKIVMGNFVKKTYIPTNNDKFKAENLDRKKAIINIDTQKWMADAAIDVYAVPGSGKERKAPGGDLPDKPYLKNDPFLLKHIPFLNINHFRDEKNSKMFKFAGHRL